MMMADDEVMDDENPEEAERDNDDDEERGEGEEGEEGQEGENPKGGNKKKLIIIVAAVIVLLIGVGAGLYFSGLLDGALGKEDAEMTHQEETTREHAAPKGGGHGEGHGAASAFLEIPTMIVNLNATDGTPRYLRLSVQLELENPADLPAVEAVIPRVVDQFQTYLRELRVSDLRGSAGIYRLQMELLWRVNQAAYPLKIKDVLFQEILIQ